jgi:hypothetical protein
MHDGERNHRWWREEDEDTAARFSRGWNSWGVTSPESSGDFTSGLANDEGSFYGTRVWDYRSNDWLTLGGSSGRDGGHIDSLGDSSWRWNNRLEEGDTYASRDDASHDSREAWRSTDDVWGDYGTYAPRDSAHSDDRRGDDVEHVSLDECLDQMHQNITVSFFVLAVGVAVASVRTKKGSYVDLYPILVGSGSRNTRALAWGATAQVLYRVAWQYVGRAVTCTMCSTKSKYNAGSSTDSKEIEVLSGFEMLVSYLQLYAYFQFSSLDSPRKLEDKGSGNFRLTVMSLADAVYGSSDNPNSRARRTVVLYCARAHCYVPATLWGGAATSLHIERGNALWIHGAVKNVDRSRLDIGESTIIWNDEGHHHIGHNPQHVSF